MKNTNQLLLDLVRDIDRKTQKQRRTEAARQGIAEAYRILGIEPKPEERAA